tara:strand:+ start:1191 stop:1721 length:531 start_codon:yes stop_codon:yes gene_type:complete
MANYIGAKTAGVIANVDGGTIENATLDSTVTFPAGHILQVVQNASVASDTTTSSEFEDITNFSVDITPSSSANKIFVMVTGAVSNALVSSVNAQVDHQLIRVDSPTDAVLVSTTIISAESASGGLQAKGSLAMSHLETLSFWTSGSLTYKVQHKVNNTSSTGSLFQGKITVMEIEG